MTDEQLNAEVKRRIKMKDPRFEGVAFPWMALIPPITGLVLGVYFGVKL